MVLALSLKGGDTIEVGVDEVGRGCWAGPVVAAAVIWPTEFVSDLDKEIKDSKKLSSKKREELSEHIKKHAVAWSISFVTNEDIDKINILNATYKAMISALTDVYEKTKYSHIIIDGNRFPGLIIDGQSIEHTCVVKGDDKYISIAAASIIAKVARDQYMAGLSDKPGLSVYKWETNAGYGTKAHSDAIQQHGLSQYHRRSFHIRVASFIS